MREIVKPLKMNHLGGLPFSGREVCLMPEGARHSWKACLRHQLHSDFSRLM